MVQDLIDFNEIVSAGIRIVPMDRIEDSPCSWWRHQMEIFSALLAICAGNSPVTGEFPTQRPVTRSFDVYFDLRPNERLSKQWWGWWFETLSRSLWRHRNGYTSQSITVKRYVVLDITGWDRIFVHVFTSHIKRLCGVSFDLCHNILNGILDTLFQYVTHGNMKWSTPYNLWNWQMNWQNPAQWDVF